MKTMESNLRTTGARNRSEILARKLSCAIICSVFSNLVITFLFVCVINFSVNPLQWLQQTLRTVTSFSTWLHLIPFVCIILAQIIICAKNYVLKSTCHLTRFQRAISVFSARTFILGALHVMVGGASIWLYLSLSKSDYQNFYVECKEKQRCLVEGNLFMMLSGLWVSFYFFIHTCLFSRSLIFPVIPQYKLLSFKAEFLQLLNKSKEDVFYPILYFDLIYYSSGSYIYEVFAQLFRLEMQEDGFSIFLYGYVWVFGLMYYLNMYLMRFFFKLFLTEPIEYPIIKVYDTEISLSEALLLNNTPIVQHLACLDLYLLSMWSLQRRQSLFTLSQPGGHPHTWNCLIQNSLKLLNEFTVTLNRSTDILIRDDKIKSQADKTKEAINVQKYSMPTQKPIYPNMRNMSILASSLDTSGHLSGPEQIIQSPLSPAKLMEHQQAVSAKFMERLKNLRMVRYLFGEVPEVQIQYCLENGQLIVWTAQGLANIAVASFTEDPYGIVQKDLPTLITCLVELKQSVEKLNKIQMFSRKGPGYDYFSFKMKNSIHSSVRRSLCNICLTFGNYLQDINLKKDVALQLQCYI